MKTKMYQGQTKLSKPVPGLGVVDRIFVVIYIVLWTAFWLT